MCHCPPHPRYRWPSIHTPAACEQVHASMVIKCIEEDVNKVALTVRPASYLTTCHSPFHALYSDGASVVCGGDGAVCACHVSVRCVWATCGEPQGSSPSSFGAEGTRIEGELRLAFSSPAARAAQAWLLRVLRAQVSAARCWLAGSWLATACPPLPPQPHHTPKHAHICTTSEYTLACMHPCTHQCMHMHTHI